MRTYLGFSRHPISLPRSSFYIVLIDGGLEPVRIEVESTEAQFSETAMHTRTFTGVALLASTPLFGCEQAPDPTPRGAAPTPAADPPVASKLSTPSLPSADSALKSRNVDSDVTRASDGTRDSDATPETALTRKERDEAMPLPGQANDHSNPEFAKRGDDKSSVEANN